MDLRSYIELKEAYKKMYSPEEVISEEVESVEEEILNEFDTSEGENIPNRAGTGHKNTDTRRDWANDPRWGVIGQIERQRRKAFGTDRERRQANSYEKSVNNIAKRQGTLPNQAQFTANDVAAETKGRRRADPNYRAGQNQASNRNSASAGPTAQPKTTTKTEPKTEPRTQPQNTEPRTQPQNTAPRTQPQNTAPRTQPKTTPKATPKAQTGDKKADMASWAKANPKLAAAKAKRDATRGTSATTNPLMKDMKSRMPAPKQPQSGGAKAASSTGGPKFNPNASRIAMGGNKVTTTPPTSKAIPSPGAKAAMAAGSKFNPNAPKIKLNNSVDMSEFDIILEHLVESGFAVEEALKVMVNMSEEKREQIIAERSREFDEPRAAQNAAGARGPELSHSVKKTTKPLSNSKTVGSSVDRGPEFRQRKPLSTSKTVGSSVDRGPEFRREEVEIEEGMHRDAKTGEVVDKAEVGKTYYPNMEKKKSSVALRKEKEAAEKKKTRKESNDSLMDAYRAVYAPKEESIEENRRAAREAGGYKDDSKKQTDPSKDGFTGISGSIKEIMKQNKEIEAANKKKTRKESDESLMAAYRAVYEPKEEISEEEADRLRDQRQERGGVDGNTRYDRAPKGSTKKHGVPGAKTPAQAEMEKKYGKGASAMDIVRAELEKKYGKGAILGGKKKKEDKKD